MAIIRPWACPKCGSLESWVRDTAHDEDGYIVRRRVCSGCGLQRSTEERVISDDSSAFYARAHSRRVYQAVLRNRRKGEVPCRYCGEKYPAGKFSYHVGRSHVHAAAIKPPANGSSRKHVRAYTRSRARNSGAGAEAYVKDNYGGTP